LETLFTCALSLLELTFIFAALMLLYALRNTIGTVAFYLSLGILLIFTQLVGATELKVNLDLQGADFYISSTVLFLPYLSVLMVIYISEGTLATQRFIIGAMAALGLYLYLSQITATQCGWIGVSISQGPTADSLEYLLLQSKRSLAGSIFAQTLDLFLLPIFFQRLRNMKCRLFLSVLLAFMLTQIIHTIVYASVTFWGQPEFWLYLETSYIANAVVSVWLSMLITLYLLKIEKEIPGEGRKSLDILFAFFGSYSKARRLEKYLQEWEGRYRMVVENASDMILLLGENGIILDANRSAVKTLEAPNAEYLKTKIFPDDFMTQTDNRIKKRLSGKIVQRDFSETKRLFRLPIQAKSLKNKKLDLDIAISKIEVQGQPMTIISGRDNTEQNRITREREELREQLTHAQRLESVGELAGGIAHDFNNYLHAIQGHLDIMQYMLHVDNPEINKHLERIDTITEQAAELTRKLLGFARKGKYVEKQLNLVDVVKGAIDLFRPASQNNIELEFTAFNPYVPMKGDEVQLQQAFLNILINARYAMRNTVDTKLKIEIEINEAYVFLSRCTSFNVEKLPVGDYCCVRITDYGEGMDKETMHRVFDPFFTTKPLGEGTGMGLSMVYGTISNHNGVIHVESEVGQGTTFYIFLPKQSAEL
jgi:signal transduction histidine kinase